MVSLRESYCLLSSGGISAGVCIIAERQPAHQCHPSRGWRDKCHPWIALKLGGSDRGRPPFAFSGLALVPPFRPSTHSLSRGLYSVAASAAAGHCARAFRSGSTTVRKADILRIAVFRRNWGFLGSEGEETRFSRGLLRNTNKCRDLDGTTAWRHCRHLRCATG